VEKLCREKDQFLEEVIVRERRIERERETDGLRKTEVVERGA
jgi:hypothetical protein